MQNDVVLYTLHLFSGAGGGILADLLLGHRPIGAVEIDAYARQVLLCRQVDGSLPRFPVWDDVRSFSIDNDATRPFIERLCGIRERLCICGGFPCTNISSAGKGEGINGKDSRLWKEYARIIGEIRPKYAFLENSNMLIRRGLDVVVTDLAEMGYSLAWGIVSAADVGACHIRKRFWGVAKRERENPNPESLGLGTTRESCGSKKSIARPSDLCNNLSNSQSSRQQTVSIGGDNEQEQLRPDELRGGLSDAGNENNGRLFGKQKESDEQSELDARGKTFDVRWQRREAESRLGGMADGISDWLDDCQAGTLWTPDEKGLPRITTTTENRASRLKAIGNAQVPLCAAVAFTMLKEIVDNYDN